MYVKLRNPDDVTSFFCGDAQTNKPPLLAKRAPDAILHQGDDSSHHILSYSLNYMTPVPVTSSHSAV